MFAARNYNSSSRLLDWRLTGPTYWPLYESSMNSTIASATVLDTLTTPTWSGSTPSNGVSSSIFLGSKVLVFPANPTVTTAYYEYDVATNTFSQLSDIPPRQYTDAVLLNNLRILLFPFSGTSSQIIDSFGQSLISITFPVEVESGIKMDDGNVFIIPDFSESINSRIYNVYSNSFSSAPIIGIQTQRGVLMKDGRIFCVPGVGATSARIYNPATNTISIPNATFPAAGALGGYKATLLPNGNIVLVGGSNIRIYYPDIDTLITPSSTLTSNTNEVFCNLLPNGKISIKYSNETSLKIFDPNLDTIVTSSVTLTSGTVHSIALGNGRILFLSSTATSARTYGGNTGFNQNVLLSQYYNN